MSQTSPDDDRTGTADDRDVDGEALVRETLAEDFAPWEKSRQAVYHERDGRQPFESINRHDDGARIYKDFGLTPFWKVLEQAARTHRTPGRASQPAIEYPEAYLNHLIHVDDAELDALERGELGIFDDAPRPRRKVMEWLADPENAAILEAMEDGGAGFHCHARPGKGKTSFNLMVGCVRNLEINNDTVLWQLTLDECEPLPLAPYMTLAVPSDVEILVEAAPVRYDLPTVEVEPTDVFRDVVEYDDPLDLLETVVPGGLYGVLPDPRFRKCERLVRANYNSALTDRDELDSAADVTPLRDWGHALLEARARRDVYLHPTTLFFDEFGDMCPRNPEANEHDERAKTKEFARRLAKARKKNCSVNVASHSLVEVDEEIEQKEKCFVTFPETLVPTCKGPPNSPLPRDKPKHISKGTAFAWNATAYVEMSWPNPYRVFDFRGEIKIRYPALEEALDDV